MFADVICTAYVGYVVWLRPFTIVRFSICVFPNDTELYVIATKIVDIGQEAVAHVYVVVHDIEP